MKSPEYWSEKIYRECPSHVMGRSLVKPEFIASIQADARVDLERVLEEIRGLMASAYGISSFHSQVRRIAEAALAKSHE
ncbi:hypothetical protein OpiT1DRAFT_05676 [Opitutaceae bacterium TAV1]|nr:hypothetical protein OpiT1DRAFT_05676 [Opitutaceae bacterium TAV1]